MRFILFLFKFVLCLALLAVIVTASGIGWIFYRALPETSGNQPLPGLSAKVDTVRDEHGVPHIFAQNMNDAIRTLGYIHASERLFQMEMQRRAGQGRLSEVIGPDTVKIDKFVRTLDLYHLAETSAASLSPEAQQFFQAYADGVNAWLTTHQDKLPPEFMILKIKPEPWKIADSVVWGKLMAVQLSKNYETEILHARVSKNLNAAQQAALFAAYPAQAPVTTEPQITATQSLNDLGPSYIGDTLAQLGTYTGLPHPASNEWVIAGSRTESGKPILANDPHLGLEAPVLWFLARIVTPDLTIEGASVPGLPIILLGQNDHIAWGFTTTGSDVQDLFIESLDLKNPNNYLTPNGSEHFTTRAVIIKVKGQKNVEFQVRSTRHGPVLSDMDADLIKIAGKDKIVSLAFTALGSHDTTSEALMRINRATDWQSFMGALKLYQAPPQNVVYADTAGNIGFINPGLVPIRKSGDGSLPADGATNNNEWTGFIPLEKLPQVYNPKSGFVFNANNAVVGKDYPYFMGMDWEEPWRANRLQHFFDTTDKFTLDTAAQMQADHVSLAARDLLPYLLAQNPNDMKGRKAIDMLRNWDGTMDKDRPEPLIFEAWMYELHKNLLVGKSRMDLTEKGPFAATSLDYVLKQDPKDWCASDCNDEIKQALADALALLTQRDGADMDAWRWGNEHYTVLEHKFYSHVPVLKDWSRLNVPSSGDFYTLDRGGSFEMKPDHPFARNHGGGYRGLYDLGDPSKSRFMITTGESGHIFSRHYGDLVHDWNDVKSFPLTGTKDELLEKGYPDLVFTQAK